MDTAVEDNKLSRLTNVGPDDELRAILAGSNFDDYTSPLFVAWQLNSACNLGCLHCCEEAGHSMPDEMTKEQALDYTAISGGEPLLCPHIFDVCESIRGNNISLKIETNGEFIDERTALKLAELKLRSVQVSLDGATADTHERLRVAGDWEKAIAACKYLVERGVNTEIVFVPTKFNIHDGQLRRVYGQNNADRTSSEKLGHLMPLGGRIREIFRRTAGKDCCL
jgi:sulfatase maturation enzyme AslB (radical SAM superfamily)